MFYTNSFTDVSSVEKYISENAVANALYKSFKPDWRKLVQDFFLSKRTLPLTYDPFFKRIFNTDIHPERLSGLLSSIMGQKVSVTATLSNEDTLLKGNSLMIMDIVVRLEDGSIATVEIQKISAAFPAERMSCYSADLLLRQYEQVRNRLKKDFNYAALSKVYTIVIFENTDADAATSQVYEAFHTDVTNNKYLHHGRVTFDTGLELNLLQEFYLISLDVFREFGYAKDDNELTAWLSLLSTNTYEEAEALCQKYQWMEEIFSEISEYVHNPEEVLGMFSEALKVMDDNMYKYMCDQHNKLVKQQEEIIKANEEEIKKSEAEIQKMNNEIQEKDIEIQEKISEIQEKNSEIQEKISEIQEKNSEISNLYKFSIQLIKNNSGTREAAIDKLVSNCGCSTDYAKELVDKYW